MKNNSGIPKDWENVKLEDIGELIMGQSPKGESYNNNSIGIPLLNGAKDLTKKGIKINQYTTSPTKTTIKGDILFCIRATLGNPHFADEKYCLGRGVAGLRTDANKINNNFAYHVINTIFERLKIISVGAIIKGVKKEDLENFRVLIPKSLKEQEKIAEILSSVDSEIELTNETIHKTNKIKRGLMQDLLTQGIGHTKFRNSELGDIPKDWEVIKFSEKLDLISGKGFEYSEYSDYGVRLLKIDNVSHGEITWNNITYLPKDYIEKYPSLSLNVGDILLALNRPITRGKLKIGVLTKNDIPSILYQRVGKVLFKEEMDRMFVYYKLSKELLPFIEKNNVGGNIPFINLTQLRGLKFSAPKSIREQKEIGRILLKIDEDILNNKINLKKLKKLKKGLMQDLLSGVVRIK